MFRLSMLAGTALLLAVMLVGTGRSGDTKPDPKTKSRVYLPKYWSRLGLSAGQKKKILKIRAEYAAKVQALKEQLKKLDRDERKELFGHLTADQKKELRQIIVDKSGGEVETPPEKKKKVDKKVPPDSE